MQVALTPWFGERDLTNLVMCIHLIPMYVRTVSLCFEIFIFYRYWYCANLLGSEVLGP
jgi:hypothetical protein